MAHVRSRIFLYACHPRLVNGYDPVPFPFFSSGVFCLPTGYHDESVNFELENLFHERTTMLSANQLPAIVKSVKLGNVMAEVVMTVGDLELVSVITRGSAEALGLKAGDAVKAVVKSTEVMLDKP